VSFGITSNAQSIAIKNACSRELSKAKFSTCCAKGWEVCSDIGNVVTICGLPSLA